MQAEEPCSPYLRKGDQTFVFVRVSIKERSWLTLSYRGGGGGQNTPPNVFLHHPKTAKGIKLKLSDFKDTPLRHILHVKPVR